LMPICVEICFWVRPSALRDWAIIFPISDRVAIVMFKVSYIANILS